MLKDTKNVKILSTKLTKYEKGLLSRYRDKNGLIEKRENLREGFFLFVGGSAFEIFATMKSQIAC